MNKLYKVLVIIIIIAIPVVLVYPSNSKVIKKNITTSVTSKYLPTKYVNVVSVQEKKKDEDEEVKETIVEDTKKDTTKSSVNNEKEVEVKKPVTDVLESQVGKMSGYSASSGAHTASGYAVGDGIYTYNDPKYGNVRILAGDNSVYKLGTIVRVKNSRAGDFIGIMLDTGGDIGFNKKFLFDLLYPTREEALKNEVSYNVTFEILRYGR